jgi:tRNA nucleotidyltransferase (CCA-adding enzyme)
MDVLRGLQEHGHQALLVGGSIRDLLRGLPPKDFDIATSATPVQVQAAFKKVIPTGIAHGTVTVLTHGHPIEVTTFRSEGAYVDGRRPSTVTFEANVDADLSRRDFTINAMAFDPIRGVLHDPFGGQDDLQARRIRCVGVAEERFGEDGLRALRAVRFATVLEFDLDPPTELAIPETLNIFRKISRERIRDEVQKLLLARAPSKGLILLQDTGLLEIICPHLDGSPTTQHRVDVMQPNFELRLATWMDVGLSAQHRMEVLDGLRLPNKVSERLGLWLDNPMTPELAESPDAALRRYLAKVGEGNLEPLFELAFVHRHKGDPASWLDLLKTRLVEIAATKPPLAVRDLALNGQQIMGILNKGPGPHMGQATRFLLDQVLEDPARNTPHGLEQILAEWGKTWGG